MLLVADDFLFGEGPGGNEVIAHGDELYEGLQDDLFVLGEGYDAFDVFLFIGREGEVQGEDGSHDEEVFFEGFEGFAFPVDFFIPLGFVVVGEYAFEVF